jgi:hypothetical protein
MNPYRFAPLPSNASIAATVTVLVAGWFTLAAGAILVDRAPPSAPLALASAAAAPQVIAPQAHLRIEVVGHRGAAWAAKPLTAAKAV